MAGMAKIILTADGQEFEIEEEIAADDELLKSVLRSSNPALGDPEIKRETKNGQMIVRITKRAGPKGASPVLDAIAAAPEVLNPASSLQGRLDGMRAGGPQVFVAQVLKLEGDILSGLREAAADSRAVCATLERLRLSAGEPARSVPVGF